MSFLLNLASLVTLASVAVAMLFCTVRLLLGPTAQDRVLALDTLWMMAMLLMLALGIRFGDQVFFEPALIIALTGFVSSIALAKFLMRGEIIE